MTSVYKSERPQGYFVDAGFSSFQFTQGSKCKEYFELMRQNMAEQLHFVPRDNWNERKLALAKFRFTY